MSTSINLTIDLTEEDRSRLDTIINLLEQVTRSAPAQTPSVSEVSAEPEPPQEVVQALDTAQTSEITPEDIQKMTMKLIRAGKKTETKKVVSEYAERISAIPEDKLTECLARLQALEG